jgi:O-antigen/teichoic acid export membrane protein
MKGKLIHNLSANTLQLVVNQAFGLLIFFVLSTGLDKNTFGQINLALAILLATFNILSFGIDQVIVRKIASGEDTDSLLSTYLFHVIISGFIFYTLLLVANGIFPKIFGDNKLLLFIGIGKLMLFFSTPFKQLAAGLERFKLLARMSVISNIIRGLALLVLVLLHCLTLNCIVLIFIAGDTIELLITIILFKYQFQIPIAISRNSKKYFDLIKESVPQIGVVVFTSALARFDWIFIGLMVSSIKLAEYSFAYKIFEISTLPLLAIAPLLVPRFTQLLKEKALPIADMHKLLRIEMIIATLIALLLYLCWAPVIDWITVGKYGSVNSNTILILSLAMPLLYFNNFLWSIGFAKGLLKMILGVITLTFIINVLGDVLLIPFLKNEGAAVAYLLAMVVQGIAYLKKNDENGLSTIWRSLFLCTICAAFAGFIAGYTLQNIILIPPLAIVIYLASLLLTKQLRMSDWKNIPSLLN